MQQPISMKQLIQQLMPRQPEVIIGRVVSENPLMIQSENDEKLILNSSNLIIPRALHNDPLKCGEKMHILVFNSGKKYYALDRAVI